MSSLAVNGKEGGREESEEKSESHCNIRGTTLGEDQGTSNREKI